MPRSGARGQLGRLWSAEGFALAAGLVQSLVVARALGPDLFGVYALVFTFASLVFVVLDPRSGEAVVRYMTEFRAVDDLDRCRAVTRGGMLLDAAWGAGGLLLVAILAVPSSAVLHVRDYAVLMPVVALGMAATAPVATSRAILGVFERFDVVSNLQFLVATIRVASVCAVALGGFGLPGIVWTLATVSAIECAVFVAASLRVSRQNLGGGIRGASLSALRGRRRAILGFVGYAGLTSLAASAFKQLDTLLVGVLVGPSAAGYYRLAKTLTSPAASVGIPLQAVLYPRLARAQSEGDASGGAVIVRRVFWRVELPLAGAALLSIPFIAPVIRLLAGSDFVGAVGPTIALVVGVAVAFATLHQRPLFLVRYKLRALLLFTVAMSLGSLAVFVPAADLMGVDGVAWARTAVLALGVGAMAVYLRSRES